MKKPPQDHSLNVANSEIRKHYFSDNYVVIAPKRNLRPDSFAHTGEPHKTAILGCHFCNNTETSIWQTPQGHNWRVKVIANAFPALSATNPKAFGIQEVIINTPDHDAEFSELPLQHIEEVFEAYRRRLIELKQCDGIRYVLVFKNDGPLAGASVPHAHCQIFGLPLVPPKIALESDSMNHYWDTYKTCAYCDIIAWETQQKVRIITEDKHFLAIAPYAASYAFETWLIPRRHETEFSNLRSGELRSLAAIIKKITARLDANGISFNYFLQESLANQQHHFVIKIEPRTTKWAGAELGTGVIINPVAPEYSVIWYQGKA
jgi:UDPglucose--hexose-1-phosphate uridylyltransferase